MECTCEYGQPSLVIRGLPNIVCLKVYVDLVFSLVAVIGWGALLANPENDKSDLTPLNIVVLVIFILRIPLAILIEIGNETENLRLLWLGLVGQIITIIGIGIILAIWALLRSDSDNKSDSLAFLLAFTYSPICLTVIIGKRIKQIKINSDAESTTA